MRVPGIPYVQGRNSYTDYDGAKYAFAVHNTANDATAENEAKYAQRRTDGVSAHLYIDRHDAYQSLDTSARAGHAGSAHGNNHALALEFVGTNDKSRAWWLANIAWDKVGYWIAYVIQHDSDYRGFQVRRATSGEMRINPKVRAFYGHNDMRLAWGGTTHTDPGSNFPWDRLFRAVNEHLSGGIEMDLSDKTTPSGVTLNNFFETVWKRTDQLSDHPLAPTGRLSVAVERLEKGQVALANAVTALASGMDVDLDTADLDQIKQSAKQGALEAGEAIVVRVREELDSLPPGTTLTSEQVEQALRNVLRTGVDEV